MSRQGTLKVGNIQPKLGNIALMTAPIMNLETMEFGLA